MNDKDKMVKAKQKTSSNESETSTGDHKVLLRPENQNKQYEALFQEIDSGQIKLPMFQREFVWDKEQSAKLMDSILKGFPIGTFIFWKTRDVLRSFKEIGNHKLPDTPEGDAALYILDGQQRITSLYAIRKGIRLTKDGKEIDYRDIYINLDYDAQKDEQIVVVSKEDGKTFVSVHDVLTQKMGVFYKSMPPEKAEILEEYKGKLTTYDFSTIVIKDYPIDIACEVFARINTGGKSLTLFEIMVAMTYDEKRNFDLAEKYEELVDGTEEDDNCLVKAKFETIPESTVMQVVAAITTTSVRGKDILKIKRDDFIKNWEHARSSLFMAVDFVRSELRITASQVVPYPAMFVPLSYFFYLTKNKKASVTQVVLLRQYFYWAGLTARYSSGAESKVGEDLKKMAEIAKGKAPKYPVGELEVTADAILNTWFATGNAFCRAVLCMLASRKPKSFDTDGDVLLDNSNLKIATSRNYHHFFPRDYLKKKRPDAEANWIANITLIDAYSNKHKIGAKAPSAYIAEFKTKNPKLSKGLKTHLIDNLAQFGVLENNYDKFLLKRSEAIAKQLNECLNPQQDAE